MVSRSMAMEIRESVSQDVDAVYSLYRRVAATPGGLARLEDEVTLDYVSGFLSRAHGNGLSLVAVVDGEVIGEIHASSPGLYCFSHVWTDLTIAVDPGQQGRGTGRALFEALMEEVRMRDDVLRVELIARESNQRAIAFYESLGFRQEGRFEARIRNVDGSFEADIPMAWMRG